MNIYTPGPGTPATLAERLGKLDPHKISEAVRRLYAPFVSFRLYSPPRPPSHDLPPYFTITLTNHPRLRDHHHDPHLPLPHYLFLHHLLPVHALIPIFLPSLIFTPLKLFDSLLNPLIHLSLHHLNLIIKHSPFFYFPIPIPNQPNPAMKSLEHKLLHQVIFAFFGREGGEAEFERAFLGGCGEAGLDGLEVGCVEGERG